MQIQKVKILIPGGRGRAIQGRSMFNKYIHSMRTVKKCLHCTLSKVSNTMFNLTFLKLIYWYALHCRDCIILIVLKFIWMIWLQDSNNTCSVSDIHSANLDLIGNVCYYFKENYTIQHIIIPFHMQVNVLSCLWTRICIALFTKYYIWFNVQTRYNQIRTAIISTEIINIANCRNVSIVLKNTLSSPLKIL